MSNFRKTALFLSVMNETTKHQGLRRQLIETLRAKGIQSEEVMNVRGTEALFYGSKFNQLCL
jgi:hypothetical protein